MRPQIIDGLRGPRTLWCRRNGDRGEERMAGVVAAAGGHGSPVGALALPVAVVTQRPCRSDHHELPRRGPGHHGLVRERWHDRLCLGEGAGGTGARCRHGMDDATVQEVGAYAAVVVQP